MGVKQDTMRVAMVDAARKALTPVSVAIEVAESHVHSVMRQLGDAGVCRSCQAPIYWIVNKNGKRVPCDPDGTNHFATCPNASAHRKKKGK